MRTIIYFTDWLKPGYKTVPVLVSNHAQFSEILNSGRDRVFLEIDGRRIFNRRDVTGEPKAGYVMLEVIKCS